MNTDPSTNISGGTKTITFNLPFNEIPYIVITPASAVPYGAVNLGTQIPPVAWYHHETATNFIVELANAVKLTWIAIGAWK